jgi:DNA repair exonuclease SbcCD ATPase subunit
MKQVNFKRVAIQHFLSVGEEPVEVSFSKGLHVITGANKDKPDRRNAIGKSTIADSIYFAIFGDTLRELKKDLIPNNITGGKTHVELDFEVVTGKETIEYKVIRMLNPSKVMLFKDGVDVTRDSIGNTNKFICDVTSATPSIFQNCVIMTVNNAVPFMAKSKIEKRKFIEDIFGMEVFSQMLTQLRVEYNELKREHDIVQATLAEVKNQNRNYVSQKEATLLKRADKKSVYLERKDNNASEKERLTEKLGSFQDRDTSDIESNIEELKGKLVIVDDKITERSVEAGTKKAELRHSKESYQKIGTDEDTCPVCLRPMDAHDVEHMEKEKETLKQRLLELGEEIKEVNEAVTRANNVKLKIQQTIQAKNNELSSAKVANQEKKSISQRITQLDDWLNELEIDLKQVESTDTDFDDLIVESNKRLSEVESKVENFRKDLSKLDIVKYVVSEEGVKSFIVNKLLELLNSKLLTYLRKLDSNSICMFNEYFEEEITNEKNKICSYHNFSGAERKSIDLACLFTFSDMRRLQGGVKYNIAIYDELFDSSFDEKGIELVTQILQERTEELDECSIVISHRKESIKAVTGEVIFMEKENGISRRVDYLEE